MSGGRGVDEMKVPREGFTSTLHVGKTGLKRDAGVGSSQADRAFAPHWASGIVLRALQAAAHLILTTTTCGPGSVISPTLQELREAGHLTNT